MTSCLVVELLLVYLADWMIGVVICFAAGGIGVAWMFGLFCLVCLFCLFC